MKWMDTLRETAGELKKQLSVSAEPGEVVVLPMENRPAFFKGRMTADQTRKAVAAPASISVIAADTTLDGDFSSGGDLEILGNVKGSVTVTGSVRISGKVIGDIKAGQITISAGGVQGNLMVDHAVSLQDGAVVIGNISCRELDSGGRIRGNIEATESVVLHPASTIYGDVTAANVAVEAGAHIKGQILITAPQDSPEAAGLDAVNL